MKRLVVLSGAGISAESGISTFRDSGGLWDRYPVEDVATPEGWQRNPTLVTEFYNRRRREMLDAQPNEAHRLVAALEEEYEVTVVTQNVDNLHERAGSSHVIHLHGELMKVCSSRDPDNPFHIRTLQPEEWEVQPGTKAGDGSLLRPWIVWFGEAVPQLEVAAQAAARADVFLIIGTSLNVYPAAGLVQYVRPSAPIYLIDPKPVMAGGGRRFMHIMKGASEGMRELTAELARQGKG